MPVFKRHDLVRHGKNGTVYVILATPEHGVRIEATGLLGYLYQEFDTSAGCSIWARDAVEMQDGRFVLEGNVPKGADGRFCGT